jgi:hypothetical protein
MPGFTAESSLGGVCNAYITAPHARANASLVVPQECSWVKKITCAGALAACAVACATGIGAPECAICLAAVGGGGCGDCV